MSLLDECFFQTSPTGDLGMHDIWSVANATKIE